jgi:hypothetical protein
MSIRRIEQAPYPAFDEDPKPPLGFRQRLRTRAFGWRGSKLAIERLKEALGEIKTVARYDPETAAEGATLPMERGPRSRRSIAPPAPWATRPAKRCTS